jgi:acyl transferase domain-containing protein/NADPH:quinone reductase-like Zn-dependent oxidoreductase/thioesterase domain-containing protein/NAD(P)-dependent dehydrogenase (short-subunit alcohol dehydrogenase family)/acyl carrier protein
MRSNEPLAIIGLGCRLPGGADSPRAFWEMICAGRDAIREIPADRWNIAAHYDPTQGRAGKSISRMGGFLDQINGFDSSFFRISAREADAMDPQQRLLLEATWEAFEDAGQKWEDLGGSPTGVFVGISTSDYATMQYDIGGDCNPDVYTAPGCTFSIAANRISYCLDLRGPSMAVDTACSSALTACHVACQSLWRGDCQMAVVAGVNALLNHNSFVVFSRMSMLSPDGRCKAFDASANGYVRSEGVGAVILKPLSAALEARDRIYAVIRATAANQDGHTTGITVPSREAQEALIRQACRSAGIAPGTISYVEAHGTGTAVGDPIEAAALGAALGEGRTSPCLIGSVKSNIGHLEAASGIASLIKVALVLRNRQIPPNLHYHTPNPRIDFAGLKLRVVDRLQAFPNHGSAQLAGINSFGFGGANVHLILEAAPTQNLEVRTQQHGIDRFLLPLAAHSPEALRQAASNYAALLKEGNSDALAICGAAATRRSAFPHRLCVQGGSCDELAERLIQFANGNEDPKIETGEALGDRGPVFVFSGQGTQWWGMGRELMRRQPIFREKIDECDTLFRSMGTWSLIEELLRSEEESQLHQTAIAQPAIFAIQVALAALWTSWGIRPVAVVGHSVGEAAAAHVAGALSLADAARIVFHRGRTMDAASNRGRMLAVSLTVAEADEIVSGHSGAVEIGARNSPRSVTLSGQLEALDRIAQHLDGRGVFNRFLNVNYAFHSHQMDSVKVDLLRSLGEINVDVPRIPLFSTVSGKLFSDGDLNAVYWWRNVRYPVHFSDAIAGLSTRGFKLFLELSAHPALTASITETLASISATGKTFCSLRRNEPEMETMFHALGSLYVAGAPIDWSRIYPGNYAHTELPNYAWQHENHWRETRAARSARLDSSPHFFLNRRMDFPQPAWSVSLDLATHSWLKDHRVQGHILFPGAAMIEIALEVGVELFGSLPVEAEDIEFKEALALPEGRETIELRSVISPADSLLHLSSRRDGANSGWTVHASAKVRAVRGARAARVNIEQLKSALPIRLETEEIYSACKPKGLDYGPSFRGLECLWRSDTEALGKFKWPEELADQTGKMQFHPAMLDACLQTPAFACLQSATLGTFLPVGVDRVTLLSKTANVAYCYTRLVEFSLRSATWNLQICDEDGGVVCHVEGYRAQAVRRSGKARANDPLHWLYEDKWIAQSMLRPDHAEERKLHGKWLIFADRSGVGAELAGRLSKRGADTHLLIAESYLATNEAGKCILSDQLAAEIRSILNADGPGLAGVVHLWSLDVIDAQGLNEKTFAQAEALTCHALLRMIQSLAESHLAPLFWIATSGAQSVNLEAPISVAQSLSIGMGRAIMAEFPRMNLRMVDLDFSASGDSPGCLWSEILIGDEETEVAWRGNERLVSRLVNRSLDTLTARPEPGRSMGYMFQIAASGVMDDMAWCEQPRRKPAAGEIEIQVESAALNFRDVLKSLGLYPVESNYDLLLGDECTGRVSAIGRGVTAFKVGDKVIASGAGCFSSHLIIPADRAIRNPKQISFEAGAAIPVAFMTAWYALHQAGRIQRGDCILIHSATGGVGLAAMQVARLAGAEIFATAGNEEKRKFLRQNGARHVFDSRSTAFAAEIRRITKGRGVDMILNSLAGNAIEKGLAILAPGGRFLEIGKRDVYANSAIGLRSLRKNVSLHVIDMGQILTGSRGETQELLQRIIKLLRNGSLQPLPYISFPFSRATEAFRQMAQAKHIGKIVLSARNDQVVPVRRLPWESFRFSGKASYLITGGLGGFSLEVARWMASCGARHLVLAGRSGAATPEARRAVARLRRQGVHVSVVKADVSDPRQVTRLMQKIASGKAPLRGVFHAAMVLDEGILTHLTPERFSSVLSAKAASAWYLHQATRDLRLDYFVLFSSVASLLGSAGQANYVCANRFLDALAHYRRALGLPALAVNWGAIKDVGFLARNPAVAEHLAAHGVYGIASSHAVEMLGRLLQSDSSQIAFADMDWQKILAASKGASPVPRFAELATLDGTSESGSRGSLRVMLQSAPPTEQLDVAVALICEVVARVMRIASIKLDALRPLSELGLDSLMAFEVIHSLEDCFAISLPTNTISSNSTIKDLALIILEASGLSVSQPVKRQEEEAIPRAPDTADQVIVLRQGPQDNPLFFIHPADGGTEIYADLAALVPAHLKVCGIESRMIAGQDQEWETIAELGRSYAQIIESQQPEGPVRVAGFSAGGIFALAVARELERANRKVSFVGVIDAPFGALLPKHPREIILQGLLLEIVDKIIGEGTLQRLKADASSLELATHLVAATSEDEQMTRISEWLAYLGIDLSDEKTVQAGVRAILRRFVRHSRLLSQIGIDPIDAPVWSWQADQSQISGGKGNGARIHQYITRGPFTQSIIAGRHFEVMNQPAVGPLANELGAALADSDLESVALSADCAAGAF